MAFAAADLSAVEAGVANGTLVYSIFSVPPPGASSYTLVKLAQRKQQLGEGEDAAADPAASCQAPPGIDPSDSWVNRAEFSHDLVTQVCGFLDVYSLARVQASCRKLRSACQPHDSHTLPCVRNAQRFADFVADQTRPCVGLLSLSGRTPASRRYIVVTNAPHAASPLEKAYFAATQGAACRELSAAVEASDAQAVAPLSLELTGLPPDTALSTLLHAAYQGHPLNAFWEWCHPQVAEKHRPRLQLA